MQAQDLPVTELLDGAKQFIVPVFQRDYSWGTKHCAQLCSDIVRIGSAQNSKPHFLGSLVYIAAEDNSAGISRWLLIDGQQRLTTLTLIIAVLRKKMQELSAATASNFEELPSSEELTDYYLLNRHGKGDRRHKLHLRRADNQTLVRILEQQQFGSGESERVREAFQFLQDTLTDVSPSVIYRGLKKLSIVDVSLTRGQDDPQMIFESLNSTGIDLTQADLIRNYVLMSLDEAEQTSIYEDHWLPMEAAFGNRYRTEFDKFVRDFLVLKLRPSSPVKSDEIYQRFQEYFTKSTGAGSAGAILAEIARYARYYTAFSLGQEGEEQLRLAFARLRGLVEVAPPVVMTLYDCFARAQTLSIAGFIEAVRLLESFVFRRSVCDLQTRSLGRILTNVAYRLRESEPLLSLKVALYRQSKNRRFPSDAEFSEALESRDIYGMRSCAFLLNELENDSKEKIDTSGFTIEHVLPQNDDLRHEWREMLGENWRDVQQTWLHRLGNVTLTGYNSAYSDKPFLEKKRYRTALTIVHCG